MTTRSVCTAALVGSLLLPLLRALPATGQRPTSRSWEPYATAANRSNELPFVNADVYYGSEPEDGSRLLDAQPVLLSQRPAMPPVVEPLAEAWSWQILPDGLIYRSYLAGVKESRFAGHFFHEDERGWLLDATLGGRVAILRYGTTNPIAPEGWQLDLEGAAMPRLDLEREWDLVSADFRIGVPLTYGVGPWQYKFAYYHLSSHLGDEEIIATGSFANRINFARDVLVLGVSYYATPSLRIYAEAGWAFFISGGSQPWEFQFGLDYSPAAPTTIRGAPFFAINGHLREEVDFGGNLVVQTGWQWRGVTGHLFRVGLHYFNGQSNQFEFFRQHEQQIGLGLWYDY